MLNVEFRFTQQKGVFPSIHQLAAEDKLLSSLLEVKSPYLVLRDPDEVYHIMKSLVLELDKQPTKVKRWFNCSSHNCSFELRV